jgi:DNA-binding NarL/FixJ family response regulator
LQGSSEARAAVLLDWQPLWLEAVERVLQQLGIRVVGKTTDPDTALSAIERWEPDIFLLELETAEATTADGVSCLRRARTLLPSLRVIVLAADDDPARIDAAFEAGAAAFVMKTVHPDDLASAIRHVFEHAIYFQRARPAAAAQPQSAERNAEHALEETAGLTARELEILRLASKGHTNAQLANMLSVTERTIRFHLSNTYRKLEVSNRTEASRWAMVHGVGTQG